MGTTVSGGKAKQTARQNLVGGQTEFGGGQNEELHVGEDKTAGLGKVVGNRGHGEEVGVIPGSVEIPGEKGEKEKSTKCLHSCDSKNCG